MNGVTFGTLHSYNDLELILTSKTIGAAKPKTSVIDVPGADGELDYTEYFGDVKYYNRELSFEFSTIVDKSEFLIQYSRLQNLFNGQKMIVTLDDDPVWYYTGRVTVNEWKSNRRIGKVVVDVNAEPYKLKHVKTVITQLVTGETLINCVNSRKKVIPTITSNVSVHLAQGKMLDGDDELTFTNTVYFEGEMPKRYAEKIIFTKGQNIIKVTPDGENAIVTIEYREGEL